MLASPVSGVGWNETEALALSVALSTMAAWDADISALLETDSESVESKASHTRTSTDNGVGTPYKPRSSKKELVALKAQVQKLQRQAAHMKALVSDANSEHSAWQQMADTNRLRRLKAEFRNAKLRERVRSQVGLAQRMAKLSQRVAFLERELIAPKLPSFTNYLGPSLDPHTQLHRLDALVPRASQIFSMKEFLSHDLMPFERTRFMDTTPPEGGAELETVTQWMLPASVERVVEAMWMQTLRPMVSSDRASMDVYEDANSLVSQFIAMSSVADEWGAIQGQVAARIRPQDLGDGSFLIVMNMEAQSFVDSLAHGCASFDGWVRIEPVRSPEPGRTGPLSLIKWYRRTLLQSPSAATMSKSERCKWTQAVIAGPLRARFEQEFMSCMHAVDNFLLGSQKK